MANLWFRMYTEFAHDPKVQSLSEAMQRRLAMLFCLRGEGKTLDNYDESELVFFLHISESDLAETKAVFLKKEFIDRNWNLANWNKRQFISDSSTDRVRKHRQGVKQSETLHGTNGTVTVTPPEAEAEAEAEEKPIAPSDEKPRSEPTLPPPTTPAPRKLGTLPLNDGSLYEITDVLVAEWQELYPAVDVVQECKSMKGWCLGNPTKLKTRKGVLRFITSWLEREQDRGGSKRPMNGNGAHANGNSVREGNDERIARINRQLEKPGGDSDLTGRRVQV
jgi:hypothetical protein